MALTAPVVDGQLAIDESSQKTERKVGSELDKQDFLMLLVTQMQYQDPLEPTSNTEYVSQLAQFSALEEMQNLNQTATNTSAFGLVGQTVYIENKTSVGSTQSVEGVVDYVTIKNGEAYVTVNGEEYSYEDIVEVLDPVYVISRYLPAVEKQTLTYRHQDAQDVKVTGVSMGSHGYQATGMAVALVNAKGETISIKSDYLEYKDGTLTISKEAFKSVNADTYSLVFVFDDTNKTVDYESVILTVKGIKPEAGEDNTGDADTAETEGSGTGEDSGTEGVETE